MRIAFDLDGTLIASNFAFPTIAKWPKGWMNLFGIEALRQGTIELMQFLQQQGEEIWIYTTSYRNPAYIHLLFLLHGMKVKGVINQAVHDKKVKKRSDWPRCSKYPPAFDIDLLIDDQEGVKLEAERYGFNMVWIEPQEKEWIEKVKASYQQLKGKKSLSDAHGIGA